MSAPISIAKVAQEIRFRCHLPEDSSLVGFVTEDDILRLLQSAVNRLSALIHKVYKGRLFIKNSVLTAQAGIDLLSLPPATQQLRSVLWLTPGGATVELTEAPFGAFEVTSKVWDVATPPMYVLEGEAIRLVPAPARDEQVRVSYNEVMSISSLTDTIVGRPGFEQFLTAQVSIWIKERESNDPSLFMKELEDAISLIITEAESRDQGALTGVRESGSGLGSYRKARWVH